MPYEKLEEHHHVHPDYHSDVSDSDGNYELEDGDIMRELGGVQPAKTSIWRRLFTDCNFIKLLIMLSMVASFMFAELVVGMVGKSLALLADAFHMFSDALSLLIGAGAIALSKRAANTTFSYGYARATTVGGFINSIFLLSAVMFIITEAIERFAEPEHLKDPWLVFGVGTAGLLVNVFGMVLFCNQGCHAPHAGCDHSHGPNGQCDHSHGFEGCNHPLHMQELQGLELLDQDETDDGLTNADTISEDRSQDHSSLGQQSILSQPHYHGGQLCTHAHHQPHQYCVLAPALPLQGLLQNPLQPQTPTQQFNFLSQPNLINDSVNDSINDRATVNSSINDQATVNSSITEGDDQCDPTKPKKKKRRRRVERQTLVFDDHSHGHSHNMLGVLLHVIGDFLGSIAVVVASIINIVFVHGQSEEVKEARFWIAYIDPVLSLIIAIIILTTAVPLCIATGRILLQSVPKSVNLEKLKNEVGSLEEVDDVHGMHVWSLSDEKKPVGSCHVTLRHSYDMKKWPALNVKIKNIFAKYGVANITIQPDFECDSDCSEGICCDQQHDKPRKKKQRIYKNRVRVKKPKSLHHEEYQHEDP